MNIGIDVDGVLIDINKFQIENGKKFFNDDKHFLNECAFSFRDMFNCTKEENDTFWRKYIWKYCLKSECVKDASAVIKKLKEDGNNIYIITSRVFTTENGLKGNIFRSMLKSWLKKNEIPYDDIKFCSVEKSAEEKYYACKDLNIDIMIEDQKFNSFIISEVSKVLLMSRPYNIGINDKNNIIRVNNFKEVYDQIKKQYNVKGL